MVLALRHRLARRRRLAPALRDELEGATPWMYPWELGGRRLTLFGPELESVHQTRLELLQAPVREILSSRVDTVAVDLACSEGWFGHKLLELGAQRVLALDVRPHNIHRATLLRDHFGITEDRLELRQQDIFELPLDPNEQFDVVLLLGLIYHVEDPVGAVRRARGLTRQLCVFESQLTRQVDPIAYGWGTSDSLEHAPASFAARLERDAHANPLASRPGILSLVPNRAALEQLALVGGFSRVEFAEPAKHHNPQYLRGDRTVMFAWP